MNDSRPKKPQPERVDPIRDWTGMFEPRSGNGQAREAAGENGHAREASAENGHSRQRAAENSSSASAGVASAYRVIDEYLRQGRRFAENLWTPLGAGEGGRSDPAFLTERFMRSTADLSAAWFDLMQAVAPVRNPDVGGRNSEPPGPFDAGKTTATRDAAGRVAPARSSLHVAVKSRRLARVCIELFADPSGAELELGHLHADDGTLPAITRGAVRPVAGSVEVELEISDDQPAGMYRGFLIERATRATCGAVTVELCHS
jgi:hypothetical protein